MSACVVWSVANAVIDYARSADDCPEARAKAHQMLERVQSLAAAHLQRPGLNAGEVAELRGVSAAADTAAARLAANDPGALDGLLHWTGIDDPEIADELQSNWVDVTSDLHRRCR